jgi:hypothetical protein
MPLSLQKISVKSVNTSGITRKSTALTIISALVLYLVVLSVSLVSTQRAAIALFDADISSVLAGGEAELDNLENDLKIFDYRFHRLKRIATPIRLAARVSLIVPPIDRQRQAAELSFARIELDTKTAIAAMELGRSTFALREVALDGSLSISNIEGSSALTNSLIALRSDSLLVTAGITESSRVEAQLMELGVIGPVRSLNKRMASQEARLAGIAEFSLLLSDVLLADLELLALFNELFNEHGLGLASGTQTSALYLLIDELTIQAESVKNLAANMSDSTPPSVAESEFGEIVETLFDLNVAIYGMLSGIGSILDTASESIQSLSGAEGSLFEDGSAIAGALSGLIGREDELAISGNLISDSVSVLHNIDKAGTISLGKFGDALSEQTDSLLKLSAILEGAPRIAADVFGIDGETSRYLVLGQTSDELRAAGGFTSSVWLLTFRSGVLIENEYIDIYSNDARYHLDEYPASFEALQLHMDAGRMYMRDVGWDPHFPSTGKLASELFEIRSAAQIDGVISLDQWAFVELASALGGLETENGLVAAEGIMTLVETETDDKGTQILASLFDGLLTSLSGHRVRTYGIELLTSIEALFGSNDLMIYSTDPEVQDLISTIGWDGSLPNSSGDRLAIVDSNVGWNKVDRHIERNFIYEVDLTDPVQPTANLKIEYTNNSRGNAADCDNQSKIVGTYEILVHGCYWNYLRVYIPGGAELVDGSELPLSNGAIAAQVGGIIEGSSTVQQRFDENGEFISGLLTVVPQESKTATFRYSLPKQVIIQEGQNLEYRLDVVVQSGTRGRPGTVVVKLPIGYDFVEANLDARVIPGGLVSIEVNTSRSETIHLKLRKSS